MGEFGVPSYERQGDGWTGTHNEWAKRCQHFAGDDDVVTLLSCLCVCPLVLGSSGVSVPHFLSPSVSHPSSIVAAIVSYCSSRQSAAVYEVAGTSGVVNNRMLLLF